MANRRKEPADRLTAETHRFVEAFVGPARCYWEVAAKISGMASNDREAGQVAARMMTNPAVKEAISRRMQARQIDPDIILAELAAAAMGGPEDLFELDGDTPRPDWAKLAQSGRMSAIKKIKFKQFEAESPDGRTSVTRTDYEIEWHDKLRALQILSRALGMIAPDTTNVAVQVNNSAPMAGMDLSKLSNEEFQDLQKLVAKALPAPAEVIER